MSAALARIAPGPLVVESRQPAVLRAILDEDCALAIWDRPLGAGLTGLLKDLDHKEIDDVDAVIALDDAPLRIAASLGAAGYPADLAVALTQDISVLMAHHPGLSNSSACRFRLEWIETDGCRRFHADVVTVRLLVTYFGRGTQWRRAEDHDEMASDIAAGSAALLKGRLLAPTAPVLHRSPPLNGTGERRLLLAIDPA